MMPHSEGEVIFITFGFIIRISLALGSSAWSTATFTIATFIFKGNVATAIVSMRDISFKAFRLMVAWPPSGPATVVNLVVDYKSQLTIHSLYVHPFCVKEMYNTSFIVNLM